MTASIYTGSGIALVAIALADGANAPVARDHHFDGVVVTGVEIIGPREALRRLG